MTEHEKHCEGCKYLKYDSLDYGFSITLKCKAKSQQGTILLQSIIDRCNREKLKKLK